MISEMRDHEKIRTVGSPRTWAIDLSSISELHLSQLGVTRTSIKGTTRCEITMRSGPLIHQDHGPSIRVDEDHEFAVPFSATCGHLEEGARATKLLFGARDMDTQDVSSQNLQIAKVQNG